MLMNISECNWIEGEVCASSCRIRTTLTSIWHARVFLCSPASTYLVCRPPAVCIHATTMLISLAYMSLMPLQVVSSWLFCLMVCRVSISMSGNWNVLIIVTVVHRKFGLCVPCSALVGEWIINWLTAVAIHRLGVHNRG